MHFSGEKVLNSILWFYHTQNLEFIYSHLKKQLLLCGSLARLLSIVLKVAHCRTCHLRGCLSLWTSCIVYYDYDNLITDSSKEEEDALF